jgi:hypothetical protein
MGLTEIIASTDFIGLEPTFTFQSNKRYKTILGGMMSIVLCFLFIAGMVYFGRDLWEKNSPMLISSSSLNPNAAPLQLTPENFPFYIALEDSANNLNYFKDETVYNMQTFFRTQKRVIDSNGLVALQVQSIPVNMVNCDINYHFPGVEAAFNTTTFQKAYCIAPGQNITIQGDFPDNQFNFLQVNFFQCVNTTTVINCKPQSVIDKSIRNTYLSISYGYYLSTPNNFTVPMERIKQEYFTTVSNVGYKQINVYLKRIFFTTDTGIIFEQKKEESFNQIDRIQDLSTSVIPGPGERLFSIGIRMSYAEDSVFRNYLKIQTVIANVGGLFKFFSLFFEIALLLFTRDSYYLDLLNENFRINDTKPFNADDEFNDFKEDKKPQGVSIHQNLDVNLKAIQESGIHIKSKTLNAKGINDLRYLNEKVKFVKQGTKLNLSLCDFIKTFYCRFYDIKTKKNRHIYNKAVKVIKKCIDINEVITKLLEYEKFKQVVLDNNELIMFNASPCPNIEVFSMNKGDKTFMSTFYKDSSSYQRLQESYNKVVDDNTIFHKRLTDLYDPHVLDFLKKL